MDLKVLGLHLGIGSYTERVFKDPVGKCIGGGGGGGAGREGAMVCLYPPPHTLLTPHFYIPLELYVYITLTHNYLAIFIYQLIILWTISIN